MTLEEILAKANKLAANGSRRDALNLLLEHAKRNESPRVLAAVGKLYLLENKPEDSAKYLKKYLYLKEQKKKSFWVIDAYDDGFDAEDIQFVRDQQSYSNNIYEPSESDQILDVRGAEINERVFTEQENRSTTVNHDAAEFLPAKPEVGSESHSLPISIAESELEILLTETEIDADPEAFELEEPDLFNPLLNIATDVNLSFSERDEDIELDWSDIEDLEPFDGSANADDFADNCFGKNLSREERAMQVAIKVLNRAEWESKYLPLVTRIFVESGWGAARIAIEREISRGALPEQLSLAREIRHCWFQNDKYWMSFYGLSLDNISRDAYRNLSWVDALRLVACFPSIPDIEEVEELVESTFERWYESNHLRRVFPIFLKFLKYRAGSTTRALPGLEPKYFDSSIDDSLEDYVAIRDGSDHRLYETLTDLGIELYSTRRYENRYMGWPEGFEQ